MNRLTGEEFKLSDIADVYGKVMETRARHQEALAYAFMESTGLKPEEIELVEMQTETGYRWFYKKLERPELRYDVFPNKDSDKEEEAQFYKDRERHLREGSYWRDEGTQIHSSTQNLETSYDKYDDDRSNT